MKKFFAKIKNIFDRGGEKFANTRFYKHFGGLGTLVMIQLKDKLNMSFKADKKGALTKLILKLTLFVVVTVVIIVIFKILDKLIIFGSLATSFPFPLFNMLFTAMILLSIVTCIASLTKSLYFSRDNLTLLSYPVEANVVFLSKLIVYYILSLLREASFILPMFLAYGIAYHMQFVYFIWLIPMFAIICLIPVAIASILSIPWMLVSMYLRKHPFAQDLFTLMLLIAASVFLFIIIDAIPSNLHFLVRWGEYYYPLILNFAKNFEHWLLPTFLVTSLATGANFDTVNVTQMKVFTSTTLPYFGIIFGSVVVMILAAYLFAKPLFFKMAAKPFEFNKRVIFHDYSESRLHVKNKYDKTAFVPTDLLTKKLTNSERAKLIAKFKEALNLMNRDEKIFGGDFKKVKRLIQSYTGMKFTIIDTEEFIQKYDFGFVIRLEYGIKSLVLVKSATLRKYRCYDPNFLISKNHTKPAFFSLMWKDILMSIRTPGTLIAGYSMFAVGPLAIALMNKLFQSINTSYIGDKLVIVFNVLIIVMIPLVFNVEFASVYSREGETSYLLKASPSNYTKTLTSKLVLRWLIIASSLVCTTIVFGRYCDVYFNKPWFIFGAALLLYTGHLIWSAELDYMNPQDQLYKEVGEGNISNPNENTSGVIGLLITFLFTAFTYFLLDETIDIVFTKLFVIALVFFACRVLLAVLKVKGYRTSRGERGRD